MTKKQEIRYHILFWIVFIGMDQLLTTIIHGGQDPFFWSIVETSGFSVLHILIFYSNYSLICPRTIPQKKWLLFALGQLLLIFLFTGLRYIGEEVILYKITGIHNYSEESRNIVYYVYDNFYFVFRILLLSVVFYFIKHFWNTSLQVSKLQLEKKQAELQGLKNQLSPHFLFNTLNSFYAELYDTRPKVADDILKLSEMLRYITYDNGDDTVLLKDDIEFLQHYIDLFKRRFDNRIFIAFSLPGSLGSYRIPSLLLINFVENAFKHGVMDNEARPVTINLAIKDKNLIFTVANSFEKNQHYDAPGIGHKNIRQRLALMYPGNHSLDIREDSGIYIVTLNIPL